jgi:parallel beta-helix repeat protein
MMVLLCIAASVCGTAGAATIYVPDDQGTIQQAVNNAIAGDTIIVRDGNYNENVDVDKRVTIHSENGSANCIVNASNSGDYVFTITADYVNITGFAVENATADIIAGIYLHADNCRVSENNVTGNYNGIHINTSSNNVIADNIVHHNSWWGIWIHLESNNNRVENNTVCNQTGYWNSLGIGIFENSQHNYIYNNTVHGNTISNIELWWGACYNTVEKNRCYNSEYGILATNDTNHNHIIDNELYENYYGIGMGVINETWGVPSPIFLDHTDNNSIYNNNCSSNSGHGIHLNCASNNTLTNNTANSNSDSGSHLDNADDNNITCNWVQNNTDAGFYLTSGSTGNKIERNNILANGEYSDTSDGYEWQFMNNQSDDVSTAGNWWGTNNTTRINASIYDWTYDAGCGNVTTNPRLDGAVPCAPTPGQYAFTTADAVIALEISVGTYPPDSRYDVSGDGNVTSLDALMILQASTTGLTIRAVAT